MLQTTAGQLLVNELLPEDLRDYNRTLDKKGISVLLRGMADGYPQRYRELVKELSDVGRDVAYSTGGFSFGLKHLRKSRAAINAYGKLSLKLSQIVDDPRLDDKRKEEEIIKATAKAAEK